MKTTEEYITSFRELVNTGQIKKDILPNTGVPLSDEFVNNELKGFQELMDSGIMDLFEDE